MRFHHTCWFLGLSVGPVFRGHSYPSIYSAEDQTWIGHIQSKRFTSSTSFLHLPSFPLYEIGEKREVKLQSQIIEDSYWFSLPSPFLSLGWDGCAKPFENHFPDPNKDCLLTGGQEEGVACLAQSGLLTHCWECGSALHNAGCQLLCCP